MMHRNILRPLLVTATSFIISSGALASMADDELNLSEEARKELKQLIMFEELNNKLPTSTSSFKQKDLEKSGCKDYTMPLRPVPPYLKHFKIDVKEVLTLTTGTKIEIFDRKGYTRTTYTSFSRFDETQAILEKFFEEPDELKAALIKNGLL